MRIGSRFMSAAAGLVLAGAALIPPATAAPFGPPLSFATLTVCFKERIVIWQGRTIRADEADCLSLPIEQVRRRMTV